jgi:hypothetical protein
MISTLKENPNGGFYCSECRMNTSKPVEICPFCGSIISNYEEIFIDNNPPDIIIGGRWYETPVEEVGPPLIDEETWNKLVSIVRRKEDESDIC